MIGHQVDQLRASLHSIKANSLPSPQRVDRQNCISCVHGVRPNTELHGTTEQSKIPMCMNGLSSGLNTERYLPLLPPLVPSPRASRPPRRHHVKSSSAHRTVSPPTAATAATATHTTDKYTNRGCFSRSPLMHFENPRTKSQHENFAARRRSTPARKHHEKLTAYKLQ